MNNADKKASRSKKTHVALELIAQDRTRTNLLKKSEQKSLAYLVQHTPDWMSSNMLTAIGFFGSLVVASSFILAAYIDRNLLLLGVLGFLISWYGDSLDGRVAFYRNKPRRQYGFVLDITMDWISIILIGCGFIVYSEGPWEFLGYGFVVMYGWEMIIALMRYKITGNYSIDSGKLGPTEARILISAVMIAEVLFKGTIVYSVLFLSVVIFVCNVIDTRMLLKIADGKDKEQNHEQDQTKQGKA